MPINSTCFLLIDDNPTFAALLIRGFARSNLTLHWAKNSEEALVKTGPYKGVILDLNLNTESGMRLLPQVKKRFSQSRIIILTGYASISTAVQAIKMGADHYLPKPATVETILQVFENLSEHNNEDDSSEPLVEDFEPLSLKRLTWEHIHLTLEANQGNISATARALKMHRRTLQRMLSKHPSKP